MTSNGSPNFGKVKHGACVEESLTFSNALSQSFIQMNLLVLLHVKDVKVATKLKYPWMNF
jgi:hypothetical protein